MNLKQLLTNFNPFKKKEEAPVAVEETSPVVVETEIEETPKVDNRAKKGMQNNWKLSEEEKQIIVSWIATGCTPSECVERAKEELDIDVSPAQIIQYSRAKKWQDMIKTIRKNTIDDLSEVAGSHKKVRVARHERIYEKAIKKKDLKTALSATEHQRKEMEEQSVNLVLNQYNILSDDELKAKHKEVMERISNLTTKGVIDVKPTNKTEATGS